MRSLAEVQLAADRARLARQRPLLLRKWQRMVASPFAFLRGASPLWAEALRRRPALLRAAPGRGGLVGDLHLENFGTFRAATGFTFHVNDFDEAFDGPWTFDVLRLLVSTLLARPELGCSGTRALHLAHALLDGHAAGLRGARLARPSFIQRLVDEAAAEKPSRLLDKRTDGKGRLLRDAQKAPDAPAAVARAVPAALAEWRASVGPAAGPPEALAVLDVTRRVAGTGSLGVERLQVLTRGDGTPWLLEVKALRGSPAASVAPDALDVAARVRRALPLPPRGLGGAHLGRLAVLVHPLFAGEDKLDATKVDADALEPTMHFLGFLAGEVHRRAARSPARWSRAQHRAVLDAAGALAGLHEEAFLEFCRLVAPVLA